MKDSATILLVTGGGCGDLEAMLSKHYSILRAVCAAEMRCALYTGSFALVCIDMSVSGAADMIAEIKSMCALPVIIVADDEKSQDIAVMLGADDFIPSSARFSSINRIANLIKLSRITREAPVRQSSASIVAGAVSPRNEAQYPDSAMYKPDAMRSHLLAFIEGGDAMLRVSKEIEFVYISDKFIALTGYSSYEFLKNFDRSALNIICGDDIKRVNSDIHMSCENKSSIDISFRIVTKSGHLSWIRMSATYARSENGCMLYYAVFTGVSREVRLYQHILDELEAGVYVTNRDTYEILYMNRYLYRELDIKQPGQPHIPNDKCFHLLMGRNSPCPFCRIFTLNSESYTERTICAITPGTYYRLRGKIIDWHGVCAHIEYITNVTDNIRLGEKCDSENKNAEFLKMIGTAALSCNETSHEDILTALCNALGAQSGFVLICPLSRSAARITARVRAGSPAASGMTFAISGSALLSDEADAETTFYTENTASLRVTERALYNICAGEKNLALKSRFTSEQSCESFRAFIGLCGIDEKTADEPMIRSALFAVCAAQLAYSRSTALENLKTNLSVVTSNIPGALSIYNPNESPRGLIYLSESWKKLTGYSAQEQLTLTNKYPEREKVFGEKNLHLIFDELKRVSQKKAPVIIDLPAKSVNGKKLWLRINLSPSDVGGKLYYCGYIYDVTEYYDVKDRLISADAAMKALFDHYDISYWEYDLEDDRVTNSYRIMRDFNLPRVMERYSETYRESDCICPESEENYGGMLRELKGGNDFIMSNVRLQYPSGRRSWNRVKYSLLRDREGKPIKALGTTCDITGQLAARSRYDSLRTHYGKFASQSVFELCYNVTFDRILEYSEENILQDRGDAASSLMGKSFNEALPYIESLIDDKDEFENVCRTFSQKNLLSVFTDGKNSAEVVYRRTMPDGKRRFVRVKAELAAHPSAGDVVAFFTAEDINDNVIARQVIRAITSSEYDYIVYIDVLRGSYTFINNCPDTVFSSDSTGLYDEVVRNCCKEVSVFDDSDIRSQLPFICELTEILEKRSKHVIYASVDYGRGIRRKRLAYSYADSDKKVIMLLRSDITEIYNEEKRKNDILAAGSAKLEEQRNAFDKLLLGMIDMSYPLLCSITEASDLLSQFTVTVINADPPENVRSALNNRHYTESPTAHIRCGAGAIIAAEETIGQITGLISGREPLQSNSFDFHALMLSLYAGCRRRAAENNIIFTSAFDCPADTNVIGDAEVLTRAISCLIDNAMKFTEQGGNVDLFHCCCPLGEMSELKIKVSDTGCGIADEHLEGIFEPFAKEDRSKPGLGLGLYICRELTAVLGGTLSCESRLETGSIFTITLSMPH